MLLARHTSNTHAMLKRLSQLAGRQQQAVISSLAGSSRQSEAPSTSQQQQLQQTSSSSTSRPAAGRRPATPSPLQALNSSKAGIQQLQGIQQLPVKAGSSSKNSRQAAKSGSGQVKSGQVRSGQIFHVEGVEKHRSKPPFFP